MIPRSRPFLPPFRSSSYEPCFRLVDAYVIAAFTYVAFNDHESMHTTLLYELHEGTERVRCGADDDTREVRRPLVESFRYCQVERLVGAQPHESLATEKLAFLCSLERLEQTVRMELTMTSTVSYKLTTIPSSLTMGTAEMPPSENICTTLNTVVSIVAVDIG